MGLSLLHPDRAGQIALHPSHGIRMEEMLCARPVEKNLHPSVFNFGCFRVLGVFDALHGRPEPGPRGAVTGVGISAQTDALLGALDSRQFGSFDPLSNGPLCLSVLGGKYRRNERPHQEPCG